VRSEALVLAMFEQVDPAGATLAVDQALGGVIRDLAAHRALGGGAGEVFVLPVAGNRLPARRIVLAGLGRFGDYDAGAQRHAAANALRTLALSGIRDCAFVLWGTASGMAPGEAAASLGAGLADALAGLDPALWPRRLLLVSRSAQRLALARAALESLLASTAAGEVLGLAPAQATGRAPRRRAGPAAQDTVYLFVAENGGELQLSLLGPGDKGTALRASQRLDRRKLDALVGKLGNDLDADELAQHGAQLGELLLPPAMREALLALRDTRITLVHDVATSRWPWEAVHLGAHAPAAAASLCRRLAADDLSVARWLESRQARRELAVLLVTNPTQDLPGAAREGAAVRAVLERIERLRVTELSGGDATRSRLLTEFRSGQYDALHFAGHAFFEPDSPGRSGILCAGGRVLRGEDLQAIEALPALMFFNACESGRVRSRPGRRAALERGVGMAEAFLRAGLANYIGTWWPVGDAAALEFARCAYGRLAAGETLGGAILAARNAVRSLDSGDWANYLHYGGHDFRLKAP
ncbi:MAG: CHAT domain-containing protein, partial [Steroidobacteraceae bacterium]|nr:CHAT domain-containing protein [Steroidobacteraceae bacterium]